MLFFVVHGILVAAEQLIKRATQRFKGRGAKRSKVKHAVSIASTLLVLHITAELWFHPPLDEELVVSRVGESLGKVWAGVCVLTKAAVAVLAPYFSLNGGIDTGSGEM